MTWASKSNCHTGNPLVFEALGVKVHAGGNSRDGGWMKMKEMPDLAIGPTGVIRTVRQRNFIPEGFSCASHVQARDPKNIPVQILTRDRVMLPTRHTQYRTPGRGRGRSDI